MKVRGEGMKVRGRRAGHLPRGQAGLCMHAHRWGAPLPRASSPAEGSAHGAGKGQHHALVLPPQAGDVHLLLGADQVHCDQVQGGCREYRVGRSVGVERGWHAQIHCCKC